MINLIINHRYDHKSSPDWLRVLNALIGSDEYFLHCDYESFDNYKAPSLFYYPLRVSTDIKERRAYIPLDVINKIKAGELMMLVDCSFECNKRYIEDWWWAIGDYFGFSPNSIIFLTGGHNAHLFPEYNVIEYNMFEAQCYYLLNRKLPPHKTELNKKKFICLNRRAKPHRTYLMLKLIELGLIDSAHWSFVNEMKPITPFEIHEILADEMFEPDDTFKSCTVKDFAKRVPHSVDCMPAYCSRTPDDLVSDMYQCADFVVVPETIYESTEGMFLTEKTFKPIANCLPFVLLGQPGIVQKLRDRGYDVFDYVIDHSYDTLPDESRALEVTNEINRLCSTDWSQYTTKIQSSVEHNYELLLSDNRYMSDLKEVHKSMSAILKSE